LHRRRVAYQGTVSAKETHLHLAWGEISTIRWCEYIGDNDARTLTISEGHGRETGAFGPSR
jgi:hypothetical protein